MTSEEKVFVLLKQIGNELQLLWYQLDTYQELFLVEQEKRRGLLQDTAPGFFAIIQVSLAESILMRTFRLMDPAEMSGKSNSTFDLLYEALSGESEATQELCTEIKRLRNEWCKGRYAPLKILRNEWLAHNDATSRTEKDSGELWPYLSSADFSLAHELAVAMWSIYRQSSSVLMGSAVIEPVHASLMQRPAMILRQLCASQFLHRSLDELDEQALGNYSALKAYEQERMGEDTIRDVFSSPEREQ